MIDLFDVSAIGIVCLAGVYVAPLVWRYQRMEHIRKELAARRVLALTYDDGPNGAATPKLLDLLAKYDARATFFILGKHAQEHPQIVDRIFREGHEVGCHTAGHLNAWKVLPGRAIRDIKQGYQQLAPWIPQNAAFRPPYGKLTLPTLKTILSLGATVWWWTIDSGDTHRILPGPEKIAQKLRQDGGGIILMHDGSLTVRSEERNNYTLAATAAVLDTAKQEGIGIVTLGELCKRQ